jgi:hypothetical protein
VIQKCPVSLSPESIIPEKLTRGFPHGFQLKVMAHRGIAAPKTLFP